MPERLCVYTVLMGGYERLLDQDGLEGPEVDLICFTDDPALTSDTWDVRLVRPSLPADPNRSSRRPKILAHEHLPDHDVSIYVDNCLQLLGDPRELVAELLPGSAPMACVRHSFRADVAEEMLACRDAELDLDWVIEEQRLAYAASDPGALSAPVLWSGIMLRRHHDARVVEVMGLWWEHILRYSRRDQLSLPAVLRTVGLQPLVHELDNHLTRWWCWPREADRRRRSAVAPDSPERRQRTAEVERDTAVHERNLGALENERLLRLLAERQARLSLEVERHQATLGQLVEQSAHAHQGDLDRELLHGRVAEVEHLRQQVVEELAELRRSWSWRLTRPLRAAQRWRIR